MSGADIIAEQMHDAVLRELYDGDEGSLAPLGTPDDWPIEEGYIVRDVTTFEDVAAGIYDELLDLLVDRQAKYGSTNIEQQGLYGVLVRIRDDKISRIQRALNGRIEHGQIILDEIDLTGEEGDTLEDAYKDLANYAVISLMLLRDQWGYPLAEQ